jgi:hypothetical protein
MDRPFAVTFVAFYYAIFSAVLITALIGQLTGHHIHGSFKDLVVVLPMSFAVTLIPGLLAFGLWVMDNTARIGAILFAILRIERFCMVEPAACSFKDIYCLQNLSGRGHCDSAVPAWSAKGIPMEGLRVLHQ